MTKTELIRAWSEIVAIVGAAFWALWTFVYQDYIVPRERAILNAEVVAQEVATHGSEKALEIRVSSENPSDWRIFLLSGLVSLWGSKFKPRSEEKPFLEEVEEAFNSRLIPITRKSKCLVEMADHRPMDRMVLRDFATTTPCPKLLGAATLLSGWNLQPKEKASRNLIIPLPTEGFDYVKVHAAFPVAWTEGELKVHWEVTPEGGLRLKRFHGDEPIPINESNESEAHKIRKDLGYGIISAYATVSLTPPRFEKQLITPSEASGAENSSGTQSGSPP